MLGMLIVILFYFFIREDNSNVTIIFLVGKIRLGQVPREKGGFHGKDVMKTSRNIMTLNFKL